MPLFPMLSAFGGEVEFAHGKLQSQNPARMPDCARRAAAWTPLFPMLSAFGGEVGVAMGKLQYQKSAWLPFFGTAAGAKQGKTAGSTL
jgi:hypothetical protein